MYKNKMEGKTISSGRLQLSGNKLLHHPEEIEKWQRGEPFAPIMIEFGPVSYCNLLWKRTRTICPWPML